MPTQQCNQTVCNTATGIWEFHPLPLPRACDTFAGPGTGKCAINGACLDPNFGEVQPRYFVLGVVYAPPGTSGSGPKSSVTYSNGSTFGTSTKTDHTFKNELSVEAELGFHWVNITDTLGLSASYTKSSGTSKSLEVKKSETATVGPQLGAPADVIDHNTDTIWLWLNPGVYILETGAGLKWTVTSHGGASMDIQYVRVGWLNGAMEMPPAVASTLALYGITSADYPTILARDPFGNGSTAIDPSRFIQTSTTVPYEPPPTPDGSPVPYTVAITNDRTDSNTTTMGDEYSVGVSLTVGSAEDFTGFFTAKVKAASTWTWSCEHTETSQLGSSQSASLTITGPAFGYTGLVSDIAVYYDRLYSTFLFVPASPQSLKASGVLRNASGQPLAHQDLTLVSNGVTYKTVTRNNGAYRFYGVPAGAATVSTVGGSWPMTVGTVAFTQDLTMPPPPPPPPPPTCNLSACQADCDAEAADCRADCTAPLGPCFTACNAFRTSCRNACCH
ncbi:MAG TPA: carboxypeptidase-like regulatory domain-containing protein [Kofleriaceae bacterium]